MQRGVHTELSFDSSATHKDGRRSAARYGSAGLADPGAAPDGRTRDPAPRARPYSAEKALALVIDMNLSKCQYQLMRKSAKSQGADKLYPAYDRVTKAKVA